MIMLSHSKTFFPLEKVGSEEDAFFPEEVLIRNLASSPELRRDPKRGFSKGGAQRSMFYSLRNRKT